MRSASWIFKCGWGLGIIAILYQIIVLLGVGDYPPFSEITFVAPTQIVAYFISAILGIFIIAITTIIYMISNKRRQEAK